MKILLEELNMNLNQKIIPQLNNYLILHNIANELSLWKKTFITEAEQVEYSQEEVKFDFSLLME
jgi:hypothetical protein